MTKYYTADITNLNLQSFWKEWLDNLPENVTSSDSDFHALGLAYANYIFVVEDDGRCKGLGVDDDLLAPASNDNDLEIILLWEDLNTAIMGE